MSPSRVWFVTGAANGLGRAIAQAALAAGDSVVATDIESGVREFADGCPVRAMALLVDVTDQAAVRAAFDATVSRFGRVDVVVNNAGYGHVGGVEELSDAELRAQLEVNFFGVVNVTRAALPHLRRQRSGHFVQMSSLNGVEGLVGGGYYAASKFAIEGLSESLADEVAHLGIAVTILEPGPQRTRFANEKSARWSEPIADYAASVGEMREVIKQLDGNQPGDPARAAEAVITAVCAERPPRRLPLGRIALENIRAALTARLDALDTWAKLATSSDFPDEQAGGDAAAARLTN
jgi:NAD(P)-dependent dehydrogenase (short-subunit alcohol dehydrogenase family)